MATREVNGKRRKRNVGLIAGAAAALLVLVVSVLALGGMGGGDGASGAIPTFAVESGPLTISISESGTISAKDQTVISSQVEGRRTIIYLIDEGVRVEKGDLLVELDSSSLQTDLLDQENRVYTADAEVTQAREAFEVARNQAAADVAQAELDFRFAKDDLKKYVEGEYPMELKRLNTEIELAEEQATQAQDTYQWSRRLAEEGYLSASELRRDEIAYNRAKLQHELAVEDLALAQNHTHPRRLAELESNVEQMKMALERVLRRSRADVIQAETNLRTKENALKREQDRLAHTKDQIAKCRMLAPTAGMVVYATTGRGGWRPQEPLEEGQEVRERQELIHLPTAGDRTVEVKIHESALDRVQIGQRARVTVQSIPGRTFVGRVARISPLPDAQSIWMNPDLKVYDTTIDLEGDLSGVRTGMSCNVEILIDQYRQATYIPVQAVVRVGRQPTVYVRTGERFDPRPVTLGLNNNRMVRVVDGLQPGELISLAPPLSSGEAREERDEDEMELAGDAPAADAPDGEGDAPAATPAAARPQRGSGGPGGAGRQGGPGRSGSPAGAGNGQGGGGERPAQPRPVQAAAEVAS